MSSFAQSHGKRICFGEWGVTHDLNVDDTGGDDNPSFFQNSYNWMTNHDVEYAIHYNDNNESFHHSITGSGFQFPLSRAKFIETFSQLPHPW
jgi:hypothetical protein